MSSKPREIPQGNTKSGGGAKSGNRGKSDIKSEKVDLNPKIQQATAEQMQIHRIIESHRNEDPDLQAKIKKVIEITGSNVDAASMALHSRDNNLEEAISLLTEGGTESLDLEWQKAGKKQKVKTAAQKADATKEASQKKENGPGGRDRNDKRNESRPDRADRERTTSSSEPQQTDGGYENRRGGRGRGRGESRGGRGGIRGGVRVDNKENDESGDANSGGMGNFGSRFNNGPMRGRGRGGGGRGGFRGGDRDRDPSRTYANRSRAPREPDFGHNKIDVWENSQADTKGENKPIKVDQWSEFPQAEDWDNEEYTGSLAESKVFVPSTQQSGAVGGQVQTTPPNGETHLTTDTATTNGIGGPTNHLGSAPSHVVAGQSIDLSLLLAKQPPPASVNPGANLLASIQSSYSSAAAQQISQPMLQRTKMSPSLQPGVTTAAGGTTGPGRPPTTATAQRTIPSKMLSTTGVEMPDDSVAKLDVQFGGLDFGATGPTFNSVVQQHSSTKLGGSGDMMYSNVAQQSLGSDPYGQQVVSNVDKEMVQNKGVSGQQGDSGSTFQPQQQQPQSRMNQQQGQPQPNSGASHIPDPMSKSVNISPPNLENQQLGGLSSSVQSQSQVQKTIPPTASLSHSQQAASSYTASAGMNPGSAFVTYNTKPAPGFPAPGFPPVISQTHQTGPGAYNAIPTGQMYGSPPSMIMTHTQQPSSAYGMGLSTYGSLPIVSASVQPSHMPGGTISNQNMSGLTNSTSSYGVPGGIPYQSASTIPNSVGYNQMSASSYNPYQKLNQISSTGQLQQGTKETANDIGSSSTTTPSSTTQLGSTSMQGNSSSTSASGKISSNVSTTGSTTSKLQNQNQTVGQGTTASSIPPGMVFPQGFIVNQGALQGMPMYGFQGPTMYSYDENQMQFLPRLPHPAALATSYFDANASSFTPGGSARSDGSSLQSYPGSDARFSRPDSSAASPVPSNLPGQTTGQTMYNIPPGGSYYYLQNNALVHPGAFAQYATPQLYPTTGLVTNNPTGAPHTVSNHQYQNKGVTYGNSYINPYDTSPQQAGLTNVTDYVKSTYSSGGPTGGTGGGKGSVSTTGSSQQSTDMSSSIYGNKGHMSKINPYEKQPYGGGSSSSYNSMGQQGSQLGGAGMGTYNVYMPPAPVLPHAMFQDANSGQRQGGQPKGSKQQQYAQQQYWTG